MRWLALLILLTGCSAPKIDAPLAARGLAVIDSTESHFKLKSGLYSQTADDRKPSNLWPAGIQLSALNAAAAVDPTRLPQARAFADALLLYRIGNDTGYQPGLGPRRTGCFYDDNEWIILGFLETYELTKNKTYLDRAVDAFRFVESGESQELGGGIWWSERRETKNTCSNAPAICCALRLYTFTKNERYLDFAGRMYGWTNAWLQDKDGLYWDHIDRNKKIEQTKWSYNTALMIRANCLFFTLTKEPQYLEEAQRVARAAEAHWFRASDGALSDESPFAHLLCESLLYLYEINHDPQHKAIVRRAIDAIPQRDDFFARRWDSPGNPKDPIRLIDQASAARAFLVAARIPTMPP